MKKLGFIGTGTISAAFIEGLVASGKNNPILVSPRSREISSELSEKFAQVRRAGSNTEVAEASDIIFLGMRPPQVEEALDGIAFRKEQIVCSFVAGLTTDELRKIVPNAQICRVLPLPAIASGKGPVAHFPAVPEILEILAGMGEVVLPRAETELTAMGAISGVMSTFMQLGDTLKSWLVDSNVETATADIYVRALFVGLADTALHSPLSLLELADDHQTKGGLNERTRQHLLESGWFSEVTNAIEGVQKVRREDLD